MFLFTVENVGDAGLSQRALGVIPWTLNVMMMAMHSETQRQIVWLYRHVVTCLLSDHKENASCKTDVQA